MNEAGAGQARGLLLDLDGTLADTLPALREVYARFLHDHAIAARAPTFERLDGLPLREIIAVLRGSTGLEAEPEELELDYRARIAHACESALPSRGAQNLLGKAQALGLRVAVVTSAEREHAHGWLERNQLDRFVATVIGAGEVDEGKPSPEPYLRALDALAVSAANSVAVEDSRLGARSAVAAGLVTYVLAAPTARDAVEWPEGLRFVTDLDEVVAIL